MAFLTYRAIDFLVTHLKHQDIHLYEALTQLSASHNSTINTVNDIQKIPVVLSLKEYIFGSPGSLVVGVSLPPPLEVLHTKGTTLVGWTVNAINAPTGQNAVIDAKRNGVSILPSGFSNKIVLPAGGTHGEGTNFISSSLVLNYKDIITFDVLQIGSGAPGSKVLVQLFATVNT
jgi:hypothetical protein